MNVVYIVQTHHAAGGDVVAAFADEKNAQNFADRHNADFAFSEFSEVRVKAVEVQS